MARRRYPRELIYDVFQRKEMETGYRLFGLKMELASGFLHQRLHVPAEAGPVKAQPGISMFKNKRIYTHTHTHSAVKWDYCGWR